MSSIIELNDSSYKDCLAHNDTVVIDVFASWCGSCRLFAPTFKKIAEKFPSFKFAKIDGEENEKFASTISMDNLPFIAVFHKGEFVGGKSTTKQETVEQMMSVIQQKVSAS